MAGLNRRGKAAGFFADTDQIIDHLAQAAAPGDVILVMSQRRLRQYTSKTIGIIIKFRLPFL